jgi:pilus assembly protein CpaC
VNTVLQKLVSCSLIALVGGLSVPAALAQSRPPPPRAVDGGASLRRLKVTVNKSQTVRIVDAFSDILVGSSDIADVIPLSDQSLYVLGKKVGTTNVSVLDSNRRVIAVVDIEVSPDTASVTDKIQAGGGAGGIRVRSSGDQLVLEGSAADATTVDRAVEIARSASAAGVVNATRVTSPQQVMLKVRFVEVNRSALRAFGVRWNHWSKNQIGVPTNSVGTGQSRTFIDDKNGFTLETGPAISALTGTLPFVNLLATAGSFGRGLDVTISALEEKGLVRRLAEPNLVAQSGGEAEFHAGGRIPYPVPQSGGGVGGSNFFTVDFEDFGVKLRFLPTVLSNGLINLVLQPEVSDIDPALAIAVGGGLTVPGFTVRKMRTVIELRDGQSFAMAGLLQNINERDIDQVPWLGTLPILGALFRSTGFRQRETELVVIVTPHLVRPTKPGDLLSTPLDTTLPANDFDLFAVGKLELNKPPSPSAAGLKQKWALPNGEVIQGLYGHILTSDPPAIASAKARARPVAVKVKN